ncbi:BEL1-like homeodomain protein 9 [Vigna radiata var. radiata]|uniref:BEL1-like homeodomain protein 9 n=1 Tax=Vigna radiata var. radiata TaxID=3916 RepID=A0A1S3TAI7_VIGRR|nr:BEL1-like homeodomain protein 9 [Vigna radiata var. radiata]
MAEGFEAYHVPQQSRRDKLRVVGTQNQHGLVEPSTLLPLYDPSSFISSDLLTSFHNSHKQNLGCGVKEERANLMMGFAGRGGEGGGVMNNGSSSLCCSSNSSSVSYLDPESSLPLSQATIQVINNNNMFLYQAQNLGEFDQGYDNNNGSEIMVFKPEPLSLSLSSHSKGVNLQRYGSVVCGDKVGGVGGDGGCVVYGGSGLNEASRCTVPMGPFTGYASILKGSRFLKPAQQLLEELCDVGGVCAEKMVADASLMEPVPLLPPENSSEDLLGDHGDDHGRKKSRLLTMLDEVYRRYRQYYQQMHAVVTSFEYVSGLRNAAPYASLAIKAMSKHFRCLKNAITDQLQFANKAHFHISNRKDESSRFGNSDRGPYSQRPGFLEHQPVWRPQRGLPERAVTVLRAWLFEHFLHPYPTDTDKLMLAKQTGLSRSQVSNWFINARVRLWKPMVEEIHMLETRQAQNLKNSQKEEHCRNKSSDQLPSDNSIVSENPSGSTEKFQGPPYKRATDELPNIPVRTQEQLNLHCTSNQPGGVEVSMGGSASNSVSLTLGLHQNHGIGLAEPFTLNAAQRFGVALETNNEGYVMSGYESQNRHFGRDVIGGQLAHDFVG